MGGLLTLLGIVLIVIGFNGVDKCGVIGVVVLFVGIIASMSRVEREDTRARANRRRYWAYGEEPDWKRRRR